MKIKLIDYVFEVTAGGLKLMPSPRVVMVHRRTFAIVTAIFIVIFDVIPYSANADVVQLKNYYSQNSGSDT